MTNNFFPSKIVEILGLLFLSLLLTSPLIFFIDVNNDIHVTLVFISFCLIFIGISYWINYRRKLKTNWRLNIVNIRILYLMLFLLFVFSIGINEPVNNILNQILNNKNELSNPINSLALSLGAVLLAPILEELIFRGIILKGLLTRYNPKYAIIISAIIFGLVHGNPLQMWGALVIGLIFGWVYYKTKSIGTTILLHFFTNFISLTEDYLLYKYVDSNFLSSISIFILIISIPLFVIITRQLIFKLKNST